MAKSHMGVYALAIVVLFVGFGCCHLAHGAAVGGVEAPVNLAEVQTLTFYKDRMTTSRRGQPIVQLNCEYGQTCAAKYLPNVVQCKNMGLDDYYQPQWQCDATLNSDVTFASVDVSCEGYDYRGDEFVLAGSCGLYYKLKYTGCKSLPTTRDACVKTPITSDGATTCSSTPLYTHCTVSDSTVKNPPATTTSLSSPIISERTKTENDALIEAGIVIITAIIIIVIIVLLGIVFGLMIDDIRGNHHVQVNPLPSTTPSSDFANGVIVGSVLSSQPNPSPSALPKSDPLTTSSSSTHVSTGFGGTRSR